MTKVKIIETAEAVRFCRQVCLVALSVGDRAGGTRRGDGKVKMMIIMMTMTTMIRAMRRGNENMKPTGCLCQSKCLQFETQVPGHAHVHHLRPAEDRHEGSWASTCARAPAPEGSRSLLLRSCQSLYHELTDHASPYHIFSSHVSSYQGCLNT